jgi:hypothetical protein
MPESPRRRASAPAAADARAHWPGAARRGETGIERSIEVHAIPIHAVAVFPGASAGAAGRVVSRAVVCGSGDPVAGNALVRVAMMCSEIHFSDSGGTGAQVLDLCGLSINTLGTTPPVSTLRSREITGCVLGIPDPTWGMGFSSSWIPFRLPASRA